MSMEDGKIATVFPLFYGTDLGSHKSVAYNSIPDVFEHSAKNPQYNTKTPLEILETFRDTSCSLTRSMQARRKKNRLK